MTDLLNFGANGEQKKIFNKIKHDMEAYREVILMVNGILKWEKSYYAGIVFGTVTIGYLILWWLDMSVLTLLSLIGLLVTVTDYAAPIMMKAVHRPDNWTGVQEKAYDEICNQICFIQFKLIGYWEWFFTSKEEKSAMYYLTTVVTLVFLAYVGATIDNLFLCYIATLIVSMYPGLQHYGLINVICSKVKELVGGGMGCIKQKSLGGDRKEN